MLLIILGEMENIAMIISKLGNEITVPFAVGFFVMHNYRGLFTVPLEVLFLFLPFNDSHLYPLCFMQGIRFYLWMFCISLLPTPHHHPPMK